MATTPLPVVARPKVISPSRIARYFFQECDRFLRDSSTSAAECAGAGVPAADRNESPATQAILDAGYDWEEEVVRQHLAGRVRLADAPAGARLRDRVFGLDATRQVLHTLKPGEYVYQPTLTAAPAFYSRFGLDPRLRGPGRGGLRALLTCHLTATASICAAENTGGFLCCAVCVAPWALQQGRESPSAKRADAISTRGWT